MRTGGQRREWAVGLKSTRQEMKLNAASWTSTLGFLHRQHFEWLQTLGRDALEVTCPGRCFKSGAGRRMGIWARAWEGPGTGRVLPGSEAGALGLTSTAVIPGSDLSPPACPSLVSGSGGPFSHMSPHLQDVALIGPPSQKDP